MAWVEIQVRLGNVNVMRCPRAPSPCVIEDGCHQTIDGTVVMETKLHQNTKNKAGQTNLIVFRQKTEVRECHGYTWILDRNLLRKYMIV